MLLLFLTNVKKIFSSKDLILIFPIFIYLIFFFGLFREWAAARLLSPIVPLLAILASKAFISLKSDKLKYLIYGLCALQFVGVLIFVYTQRKLTPDEIKAFDYLKKEASTESRILTIEESIADRIFFSGDYKKFSRISICVNTFMKPLSKSNIPNTSFYPIPKIRLSLIKIEKLI